MNRGRPIFWHEGVFLRPQHFQQQDDFHDAKLKDLCAAIQPEFWGVKAVSISEPALKNQVFDVDSCEILFQDGTLIQFPGNARLERRSFEGLWDAGGKPLSVYLGVKRLTPDGINVAQAWEDAESGRGGPEKKDREDRRFLVSDASAPTRDLYARGEGQPILYLEYNLRVFFEEEARQAADHVSFKIAEVQRFGSEVRLVESYVPPLLQVGGSPYLLRLLRDASAQMTARGHELAEYKRGGAQADMGSRDLLYLLGLMTLNRWVPLVSHWLDTPTASPWGFYGVLRQVVGELSTFSDRYDVFGASDDPADKEGLPPYRHTDLGPCFSTAARVLSRLLEELTAGPDFVTKLLFDGTYYCADVPDRIFQGNNRYYLSVRTQMSPDQVVYALQSMAKFSSRVYLPILIARALPGVGLQPLTTPPNELPRRAGTTYFALEKQGAAWEAMRDALNVAIYFETAPGDIDIDLMVIYGK